MLTIRAMLKRDVIEYFKSVTEVARVLKISRSAVYQWGEVVPDTSSYKLELLTGGALKVEHEGVPPLSNGSVAESAA